MEIKEGDDDVVGCQKWVSEFVPPSGHESLLPLWVWRAVLPLDSNAVRAGEIGAMVSQASATDCAENTGQDGVSCAAVLGPFTHSADACGYSGGGGRLQADWE